MEGKFQNKYRIPSARLQNWDYRWAGVYFITICTKDRIHYFGEVKNGKMYLSPVGVLADVLWYEIKNHNKKVELGRYVVMPNHIHGILILNDENLIEPALNNIPRLYVETLHATSQIHQMDQNILRATSPTSPVHSDKTLHTTSPSSPMDGSFKETLHATSLPENHEQLKNIMFANISPKSGSISTIIRSYKSAVTKHSNRLGLGFGWQTRFYDHIIRDEKSFHTITNYIINNPLNWDKDKFYRTA